MKTMNAYESKPSYKPPRPRLSTTPSIYITAITFLVGGIAAGAGFFGGVLLFPDNNMAPLLFIPLGTIGIVVGMVLGIARSALRKDEHPLHAELWWLAGLWALTVLVSFKTDSNLLFVCLQVLPVLLGILLMNHKRLRPKIPVGIHRCRLLYPITALLFLITSLFPPVTHNKWMPPEKRAVYTESNPMPKFQFCNSPRLDASRSYAELSVDSNHLLLEWLAITVGAGLTLAVLAFRRQNPALEKKYGG